MSSTGEWHMQWSDDSHRFDVRLHGTVAFTDDLTDVKSMSDGGSLSVRSWSGLVPHTVEITAANGTLTRTYFVGGAKRTWDDEAKAFLATQLPILVRNSGIGAESRVRAIFAVRGAGGVFDEIDRLGGDYARRLYFVALIDVARFDAAAIQPLLQRVGQRMTSDYDRRTVLEHVAAVVPLDRSAARAYVQAMATMRSDYDQRVALAALTTHDGAAVDADTLVPALAHMSSSYDKRVVLADILGRGGLSADARTAVIAAVAGLSSDYDRAEVLLALVPSVDAASRPAFVSAAERIKSSYDQNRVLAALVKAERR